MRLRGMTAVAVLLAASVAFTGPSSAGVSKVAGGIEFTYEDPSAGSVSLAGDFNNWDMNADKMAQDTDGVWRIVVELAPGEYEYKFVVNGSEWIADPDNPRIVGSYGNSGLTIDQDGEPVAAVAGAEAISNTPANARVRLDGWYRATYDTRSKAKRDPRWRLSRPAHELYLEVNPTVSDVASGNATLHVTTGTGDIKEITADIYSGHVTLEGGPFSVTGFYNEERIQFDDPLETVGHRDLYYTIPEEQIPFGRGAQGLDLRSSFWRVDLNATYANVYDYGCIASYVDPRDYVALSDPGPYDNTETDLLAARLTRPVGPLTLGATYTSWRDGWWIGFGGTNTSPQIDEYRATHPESRSDWFELARTESWTGIDANVPLLDGRIDVRGEVAKYIYDNRFDMGNQEKVEGESYSNGSIDVPVGDTDGWVSKVILDATPAQPLDLRFEATARSIDSMNPDELYVAYSHPQWLSPLEEQYTEVKYAGSPMTVNVFAPSPKRDEKEFEFDGFLTFGIIDLTVEYDLDSYEWTYVEPLESYYGPVDVWKQTTSRIAAMANVSLSDRLEIGIASDLVGKNYDDSDWKDPSRVQVIGTADIGLWEDWSLLVNVRHASYTDFARFDTSVPDSVEYGDGTFTDPYVALVYSPRENVEIRVGYGVNPTNYVDTPVEGRDNGRERWMSEYLWNESDYDWLDAERALEDERTIGVMAVLTF